MPFKPRLFDEYRLGEYEEPDNPCGEREANFFPSSVWTDISEAMVNSNKISKGLESLMEANAVDPKVLDRLAAIRCAVYRSMTLFIQVLGRRRDTGELVCPPVCVETVKVDRVRKTRSVDRLDDGM